MNATALRKTMNPDPQEPNTPPQSQPMLPAAYPKPSLLILILVFLFRILVLSVLGLLVGLVNLVLIRGS